jgi:tellurite resistance protein TehA-like permease
MSFINRSTSVVPARQLSYRTIPASFFAIPLGLLALGLAWQTAESIWSEPKWVSDTLIWFGAALWAFLLIAYLRKCYGVVLTPWRNWNIQFNPATSDWQAWSPCLLR